VLTESAEVVDANIAVLMEAAPSALVMGVAPEGVPGAAMKSAVVAMSVTLLTNPVVVVVQSR
jgi:hypothetical protein